MSRHPAPAPPRVPFGGGTGRQAVRDRISAQYPGQLMQVRLTRAQRARRWVGRTAWKATHRSARHGWRKRRTLAPLYAGVLTLLLGELAHVVPTGVFTAGWLGLPAAAVCWWWVGGPAWKLTRKKRAPRSHRVWWLTGIGVCWALLFATAIASWAPPIPGFVAAATIVFQIRWLWHRRVRPSRPGDTDDRLDVWKVIAGADGALPGARLDQPTDIEGGWTAMVRLVRGKQTARGAVNEQVRDRIASAYGVPDHRVTVELTPDNKADRIQLTVYSDHNPLRETQWFEKPSLDPATGFVTIGKRADGSVARWRLWVPGNGGCHGFIFGTTGAGKSELINLLCTEITHSGLAYLMLGDPEDGESVPEWQDHVPRFAWSVDEIRTMLQEMERGYLARKHAASRHRWTDDDGNDRRGHGKFTPTPTRKLIVGLIDEAPDVLADDECRRIIRLLGKKGRKFGVVIVIVAQVPSLEEVGDQAVRSMLSSMNIVAFRTSDRMSSQMGLPKALPIDPVTLPDTWPGTDETTAGLGFQVGGGEQNATMMRALRVAKVTQWALSAPKSAVEDEVMEAFGPDHVNWRARRDAEDGELTLPGGAVAASSVSPVRQQSAADRMLELLVADGPLLTGQIASRLNIKNLSTVTEAGKRLILRGKVVKLEDGLWAADEPEVSSDDRETETAGAA